MAWIERRTARFRVRYRLADGTVGTDSWHPTKAAAEIRCKQVEVEHALDTYLDPALGRITLAEWVAIWEPGHIAGPAKWAAYRSHLRIHILPRFGDTPLNQITRQSVKVFVKHLKQHLADSSVSSVMALFGLLMREAVIDRRIPYNPCQGVKVVTRRPAERPHATPAQVNEIAARIDRFSDQILVITAAYTGMRWGELAGLARANIHLDDGLLRVDPKVGALHEVAGDLYLGPPKTADSARDIHLPPFLVALLRQVLDGHDHDQVFCGARGGLLRRSSMSRRVFGPAVNGNPRTNHPPVIAGMHFHDLRHNQKTWLIEDDIPEVAQAQRLGHRLAGVRGIYSHVTPPCSSASSTPYKRGGRPTSPASSMTPTTRPSRHEPSPAPSPATAAHTPRRPTQPPGRIDDESRPYTLQQNRKTILCSPFAPLVMSKSKTARYPNLGNEPSTCGFTGGRYWV